MEGVNVLFNCDEEAVTILMKADDNRRAYMEALPTTYGLTHTVDRSNVFHSVTGLYSMKKNAILSEHPLKIAFKDEKAIDMGGVCRDRYSAFYEDMYLNMFDGNVLLTPVIHPQTDLSVLPTIGTIISHAYLVCGVLPGRIFQP